MHKSRLIAIMAVSLLLTACGSSQGNSIEKTGEESAIPKEAAATSAASTEKEPVETKKEETGDYPAMIMVDGTLYSDSGKISDVMRCGMMDGEIDDSVDDVPKKDNQSNFGAGYGYQFFSEKQIDVCIDDEWHIFVPYDETK